MTTQGSNAPDSQGKGQDRVSRGGVVGDDKSKDGFSEEDSGPSFGSPQEGERATEADETSGQAQ